MATMGRCVKCKVRWSWTKERDLIWTRCPVCGTTLRQTSEWHEWPELKLDDRNYPSYYSLNKIWLRTKPAMRAKEMVQLKNHPKLYADWLKNQSELRAEAQEGGTP